jgi:hypothetical protein
MYTVVACVWFDARVRPHVLCESTLLSCPVCAFFACVWFDARVNPHVTCEIIIPIRLVQAHRAREAERREEERQKGRDMPIEGGEGGRLLY